MIGRRRFLAGVASCAVAGSSAAQAAPARRLAALDWGLAAAAAALGVAPIAVAEQALYRVWVGEPVLPPGTIELGLRTTPSLEGLAQLRPDLILVNPLNASLRPRLETIAPTFSNTTFAADHAPLLRNRAVTRALAEHLGRPAAAEAVVAAADLRLARARDQLAGASLAPAALLPVTLIDARHLTIYGDGSLYDDVLRVLGLRNGFEGPTNAWGTALRGIDDIARMPPADLLVISPVPAEAESLLHDSDSLLARMLAARVSRLHRLAPAWPFGGLSAAAGFAEGLATALRNGAP